MSEYEIYNIILQAILALVTIILAILAVFGTNIRKWFFRPILSVMVGSKPPFTSYMKKKEQSEPETITECQNIMLKVSNSGKTSASRCKILVQEIYKQRQGSSAFYKLHSFIPSEFLWDDGNNFKDVLPNIPSFLAIAKIAEKIEQSESNVMGTKSTTSEYALFILIEDPTKRGTYIDVGKGTIVLPIVVCAENLSTPIKQYVEIYWDGKDASDIKESAYYIKLRPPIDSDETNGGLL